MPKKIKTEDVTIEPNQVHVGSNIKTIRETFGESQEELGVILGLTQREVSELELAQEVDAQHLNKICEHYGQVVTNLTEKQLKPRPKSKTISHGGSGTQNIIEASIVNLQTSVDAIEKAYENATGIQKEAFAIALEEVKQALEIIKANFEAIIADKNLTIEQQSKSLDTLNITIQSLINTNQAITFAAAGIPQPKQDNSEKK